MFVFHAANKLVTLFKTFFFFFFYILLLQILGFFPLRKTPDMVKPGNANLPNSDNVSVGTFFVLKGVKTPGGQNLSSSWWEKVIIKQPVPRREAPA